MNALQKANHITLHNNCYYNHSKPNSSSGVVFVICGTMLLQKFATDSRCPAKAERFPAKAVCLLIVNDSLVGSWDHILYPVVGRRRIVNRDIFSIKICSSIIHEYFHFD